MLIGHASGLLLHPTSLPNSRGIGDLGPGTREFLDWLADARQRVWQVLPLGPTDHGDSPYQSPSAFAGNPYLISLDLLAAEGLVDLKELETVTRAESDRADRVNFEDVRRRKLPLLTAAARRLISSPGHLTTEFEAFCAREANWLGGFVTFMSLREANAGKAWCEWTNLVDENFQPRSDSEEAHAVQPVYRALQFFFDRQWQAVRREAHQRGILLVGDVPIYVSYDSADVWSHREFFQLDSHGRPTHVAGVPPDYFSATGQLWNNPLYNWDVLKQDGYRWWIRRMQAALNLVDMVRLDHFRGFEAYWSVPAGETTAVNGQWVPGPRGDFLQTLADHLHPSPAASSLIQGLPVIAEDLGMITQPVHELRQQFGLPGMNVLQFILPGEPHDPVPNLQAFDSNSVVYTGTHDNDTTHGWYASEILTRHDRLDRLKRWMVCDHAEASWKLLELAWKSSSALAVAPIQDLLGLDSSARMNTPGTFGGDQANWQWRLQTGQLTTGLARRLAELTESTGRAG